MNQFNSCWVLTEIVKGLACLLGGQAQTFLGDRKRRIVDEPVLIFVATEGGGCVRSDLVARYLLFQEREKLHLRQIIRAAYLCGMEEKEKPGV